MIIRSPRLTIQALYNPRVYKRLFLSSSPSYRSSSTLDPTVVHTPLSKIPQSIRGPDAVKYIINHADLQAVFCVPSTLNILLSLLSKINNVRIIMVVGGTDEHLPSLPTTSGVQLLSYSKLLSQHDKEYITGSSSGCDLMVDDGSGVKIAPVVRWVSTALGSTNMLDV